jgi:hypothetical protein
VSANEAGDGAALRIQTLLPVARGGYGTVWIDCGELWTLRGSHSRPKHVAALPSRGAPIFDATESTNLDLRINWLGVTKVYLDIATMHYDLPRLLHAVESPRPLSVFLQ